jgi:hypothetical protein
MFGWVHEKVLQRVTNLDLVAGLGSPTDGPFDRELRLNPLPETESQFAVLPFAVSQPHAAWTA